MQGRILKFSLRAPPVVVEVSKGPQVQLMFEAHFFLKARDLILARLDVLRGLYRVILWFLSFSIG